MRSETGTPGLMKRALTKVNTVSAAITMATGRTAGGTARI